MKLKSLILITIFGSITPANSQATISGDSARVAMESLATCTLENERSKVVKALASQRDYKKDARTMRELVGKTCVSRGTSVAIDPMLYRGALFRALVREDYSGGAAQLKDSPFINAGSWASVLSFAGCVVRSDPTSAYNVVMAQAGSSAEQVAFDALQGPINRCKPWETMTWTKAWLISFFSEAYYHETFSPTSSRLN